MLSSTITESVFEERRLIGVRLEIEVLLADRGSVRDRRRRRRRDLRAAIVQLGLERGYRRR